MYNIRDAIYGFVTFDEQEKEIINHPVFQRLRRIKQLSLTDMIYPGATHTRFEHSIGVMQMVTDMFESVVRKPNGLLKSILALDENGIKRVRKRLRLAALLHDIGHAPFSHAGEETMQLLPEDHYRYDGTDKKKRYDHEDYSIAIIKEFFSDIIQGHPINNNYNITVDEITALLGDHSVKPKMLTLFCKDFISGQLDADRADYLLRDSLHMGISYGLYDRNRLVSCMTIGRDEFENPVLAIEEGGWHIAESLVIARYQMFSQVYFHKTRRIYDFHVSKATKEILKKYGFENGYPAPTSKDNLQEYINFDDWFMQGAMNNSLGGVHGNIILKREHYRCAHQSSDIPTNADEAKILEIINDLNQEDYYIDEATATWYKVEKDIMICPKDDGFVYQLSIKSNIVRSMIGNPRLKRLYVKKECLQ
ncbi:MAG: hypothetical protein BGN88_05645 [Clostridiales bacterium 43-6]|nr:MAG: hypothetical protein BGN88_05645 [Clostridiales bacterium 43-6]